MSEIMKDGMTLSPGNPLPQFKYIDQPAFQPERDAEGKLTKRGVQQVLDQGGTVLFHKVDRVINGQESTIPVIVARMEHHPLFGKLSANEIREQRVALDKAERELKLAEAALAAPAPLGSQPAAVAPPTRTPPAAK